MSWSVGVYGKPRDEAIAAAWALFEHVKSAGHVGADEIGRGEAVVAKAIEVVEGAEPQDLVTITASGSAWQSTTGRSMNRGESYYVAIEQREPPVPELAPGAFTAAVIAE
jgi:hypothetical protein